MLTPDSSDSCKQSVVMKQSESTIALVGFATVNFADRAGVAQ